MMRRAIVGLLFVCGVCLIEKAEAIEPDVRNRPEMARALAEVLSRLVGELDLEVSVEEFVNSIVAQKGEPDAVRIIECLRSQGLLGELMLPSREEMIGATRPMLIRTTDGNWHSFRSSVQGQLRPLPPGGEGQDIRTSFETFSTTWSGIAIMVSRPAEGESMPKPAEMVLESEERDFGRAVRGKAVEAVFAFQNGGEQPLRFRNAAPDKKAVGIGGVPEGTGCPPGSSGEVTVTYDTGYTRGPVAVSAKLMTNDPRRLFVSLKLKGTVVDAVVVEPREVEFAPITGGATAEKTVQLKSADGSDFSVTKASADQPFVRVSVGEGEPEAGSEIALEVVVDSAGMDDGLFDATCTVHLSPAAMGPVTFRGLGTVVVPDTVEE